MTSNRAIFQLASRARETGFHARLGRDAGGFGMAVPGAIRVTGPDALGFMHSQVTNEVEGLSPGQGNLSARVTRTGQLVDFFSLHRLPDCADGAVLILLIERERLSGLIEGLDKVLFSDDVRLEDVTDDFRWSTIQGQLSPEVMTHLAPSAIGSWDDTAMFSVQPLTNSSAPQGSLVFHRSLTGDSGFVFALPDAEAGAEAFEAMLADVAAEAGLVAAAEPELSLLIETLRIEAGVVRVGPDTAGRKRILPETGLEQQTVSYTKGCYLGQEVIARVRTYGALPFSLRGLVVARSTDEPDWDAASALLDRVPPPGADVIIDTGKSVGQLASRALSPVAGGCLILAYLDKQHRTPGQELTFELAEGPVTAEVVLPPIYSAPGREERVAYLYDRAVRVFAQGRQDAALELLEEALRIDPTFSDGYEAVGVMLGRSERFHEAIDIFKRLEEIAPDEPMVNTNLSLYFMKIGEKETAEAEAAKAMQKSMAKSSGRSLDGESLDAVLAEQKRSDALRKKEMFAQVLEIDAEDPVALFGLGNALSVLDEWDDAARLYAAAAQAQKDNSAVYLAWGKALEQLGRQREAEPIYRAGMEVASRKGDLMPLKEMEHRVLLLSSAYGAGESAGSV
jgi:folate-binding protein YgfZ